ncbi:hypothetical protein NW755_006257 [Fusarium falciforme]|uniref:Uncharacterized protein n=1 Tax=Fusarium falciforme TaxID=195108 RepID=A0A9W8R8S8_9HYPO|nr:hypothetical protein NW755_006257 [Fusarium falciforme]
MSSDANLLALPYEVREQIFQQYFKLDRGYFYDGDSEKLVTAEGQPIDLSLMYTCRSIADDTKHIPLSVNTITFSTVYREDWRERAGGLGFVTPEMYSQISLKFPQSMPNIRKYLTAHLEFLEEADLQYPRWFQKSRAISSSLIGWYGDILGYTRLRYFSGNGGATRSSISGAIAHTLRLLVEKHPAEFAERIDKALPGWSDSHSPDEFLDLPFDPWAIPSLSEVVAAADQLQAHQLWEYLESWHHVEEDKTVGNRYRQKLYFSAAAVAIRFLNQLPKPRRLQIRNIIINEDRLAVGSSEGHVLGLIPFCKENSKLHVEQHVNLWRNLLLRMEIPHIEGAIKLAELGRDDEYDHKLSLYRASSALASWGFHAMEVMGEGMPAGTFSFVLDGDPDLNLSSDLFDTLVHPTVAWLKAYNECSSRGLFPQPCQDIFYFTTATYLQGIKPLLGGTSFLQTNFNAGQPWDYKKLAETRQDLPFSAWKGKYYQTGPMLDVSSPALDLVKVKLEFVKQKRKSDYLHSSLNLCRREKKRLRRVRRRWACIETEAEDNTEEGQRMRTLFGDVHKVPPCMTRFEKRRYRKERRAQKAAAGASHQTQEDLTDIEDMETSIFGDFFEPRTGLWWW